MYLWGIMKARAFSVILLACLFCPGFSQVYGQSRTKVVSIPAVLEIEVIIPLSIAKESNLSFGYASPGQGTGYVTLTASENPLRTASGVATLLPSPGAVYAGKFRVTGGPNASVNVNVPTWIHTLIHSSGSANLNLELTTPSATLQLSPTGQAVFYVGGTVTMWWGQALGQYTGTFTVTVSYQ